MRLPHSDHDLRGLQPHEQLRHILDVIAWQPCEAHVQGGAEGTHEGPPRLGVESLEQDVL